MFKGSQPNPYDDIVNKTTDENLTGENWELILNLCDKVIDEGEQGARNVIAAVLKRLAHRNPNVQLYALSLAESLSKNCGIELHREIASRAFTQGLEKIITDRTTHDKVKRRALVLIAQWTAEFETDPTLGVMEDCYNNLKLKNYKFEAPQEPPPPDVDDEVRRREEEELQRVLAMSVQDKGGRTQWDAYSVTPSNGAGGSGSASDLGRKPSISAAPSSSQVQSGYTPPTYHRGYAPTRTPSPKARSPTLPSAAPSSTSLPAAAPVSAPVTSHSTPADVSAPITSEPIQGQIPVVTRVRALHTFEPTEAGELAFDKGDVIKVVDRGYKDWWRGQLKGRTGIFPVNYVEPLPEPTAAELAKEAEQEAAVFAQAVNVDKLLTMLRALDPAKDNLADNEEIQELYRSSMALRPKIVKLIDKYSQKRADLVSMNESFVKARTIFDRMMEDSLAMHSGFYEQSRPNYRPQASSYQGRPDSRGPPPVGPQPFGWNPAVYDQPGYNAYPAGASPYPQGPERPYQGPPQPVPQPQPQPYVDPSVYAQQQQAGYAQQPYGASPYPPGQSQQQVHQQQPFSPPPQQLPQLAPQLQQQPQPQSQPSPQSQQGLQRRQSAQAQQPVPVQQPAQTQQPTQASQPALVQQSALAQQPTKAQQPLQTQQAQAQPQAQQASPQQQQSGPPYAYEPNGTYADPNVQAWANYYAQGGKDLAGAVYFISVPGVTDSPPVSAPQDQQSSQQTQPQPQHDTSIHSASTPSPTNDAYQAYHGHAQQPINDTAAYGNPSQSQPQSDSSVVPGPAAQGSHVYDAAASASPMTGDSSATQPPWARSVVHGQPLPNPSSPNPQSQLITPTHSFHAVQPQGGQQGWHSQYNAMQSQMGAMDIGVDGISQHPGQQQVQQPYQGVGAPA
jgi:signal transducing adaptor molecule